MSANSYADSLARLRVLEAERDEAWAAAMVTGPYFAKRYRKFESILRAINRQNRKIEKAAPAELKRVLKRE